MKAEDWGAEIGFACADCQFFEVRYKDENQAVGACHRYPPREWFREAEDAIFTMVCGHDWCGEFELTPARRAAWEAEKHSRVGVSAKP